MQQRDNTLQKKLKAWKRKMQMFFSLSRWDTALQKKKIQSNPNRLHKWVFGVLQIEKKKLAVCEFSF